MDQLVVRVQQVVVDLPVPQDQLGQPDLLVLLVPHLLWLGLLDQQAHSVLQDLLGLRAQIQLLPDLQDQLGLQVHKVFKE